MPTLISQLRAALGRESVLSTPSELTVYDCDAFTIERHRPAAVVLPRSVKQVAEVVQLCQQYGVPVIARGAGTSLAGGCLPLARAEATGTGGNGRPTDQGNGCPAKQQVDGGVVVMLTRMNKILDVDLRNRMAVVEAGVPNLRLTQALAGSGFHFAPDPSSQGASTIGGNVATNAGGPHTLKYGVTVNHVLGLECVLGDGSIVQLGPVDDPAALDLIGILVGSEGTLAIVTKVWVRLTPNPQDHRAMRAIFESVEEASNAVSQIIAAGIIPAAMELMDQGILAAVEEAFQFGFPPDAGAVLVIEVDGPAAGLDQQQEQIVEFCRRFGAREVLHAASAQERELLWKCRKLAVGATGRLSPSYTIQDGVVPRSRLPQIIRRTAEIGQKYQIRIVNVAHAGDGNIHPILLFDERDREQVERALAAGREILMECIAAGGSITAEHGVGVEKIGLMDRLFASSDLDAMRNVRQAFDPTGQLNPGKLIPGKVGARG
jgi:glycolate oxidase